ncbi:hypothetical protein [Shouchella patagoniensis]|uniref:hypothetical protein n=1 Tax=Shouchella patagoniensis TaxID=228576 RepID=UPI000994ABBF|nr:hypothetical protein [Shouchella patagoniensis]
MFSPLDWFRLFMAALFILPLVTVIRESGYYLAVSVLGETNKKLIIGSTVGWNMMNSVQVHDFGTALSISLQS